MPAHHLNTQVEAKLRALSGDAQAISAVVAEAVCTRLHREVRGYTDGEFDFELASNVCAGISAALAIALHNALEQHLGQRLESILVGAGSDADWESVIKMVRLRPRFEQMLEEALEPVRPGAGRLFGRLVGGLFRDDLERLDAMAEDAKADAVRVRQALLAIGPKLRALVQEETYALVSRAYLDGLALLRLEGFAPAEPGRSPQPPLLPE